VQSLPLEDLIAARMASTSGHRAAKFEHCQSLQSRSRGKIDRQPPI
jgi:hypothetical protein